MNNIKISIIIPVYNTSKFLEKCLKSVVNQSLKEIEIICINDGSTDSSLEILERLQKEDNRIILINKEKNCGVTSARNTGLKIARGKYCLNIDSDDWIDQGYLKALYERAKKDDLDITLSNIIFDFKEENKKSYILNDLNISDQKIITGKEYSDSFLENNFYGYTWNKLIKTELYKKNNINYNEKIFLMEDVEIILRLAYFANRVGKINKAYYHYIQHNTNGSKNLTLKSLQDINNCFLSLFNFYNGKNIKIEKMIVERWSFNLIPRVIIFKNTENKEYQELENKSLKLIKKINFSQIFLGYKQLKINYIFYLLLLKSISSKKDILFLKKVHYILKGLRKEK